MSATLMDRVQEQFGKIKDQFSHQEDNIASAPQALEDKVRPKSLPKGLLAGLIGGICATAAQAVAERVYPARVHGESDPKANLAEKVAGHPLDEGTKAVAAAGINWGLGAIAGAAYGALAEYYPAATAKEGATFGMVMGGLTTGGALPALGVSPGFADQHAREQTTEMASHVLYGTVTETVRRFVRRRI